MTTYTIDKDALTVNLMRIVGIDKHQARECADVVLQMLAETSTSPDAQDAARYRWLRDSESIVSPGVDLAYDAHRAAKLGNPKIIDAAIDDAIKGGA